jgi:hypothetical protein
MIGRHLQRRSAVRVAVTVLWIGAAGALFLATPGAADAQCPALPGDAFAFLPVNPPSDHCPAVPAVHWADSRVVFECGFFADGTHGVDCGENPAGCVALCRGAAELWNSDLPGRFTFVEADASTPVAFCTSGSNNGGLDGRTSIGGSTTLCDGSAFGGSILAITLRRTIASGSRKGELLDSDITVNTAFQFDPSLFRHVIGHELGHVLGLDHPDQCGHDFNVLMRSVVGSSSNPCFVEGPTTDDVNGADLIYALVGPTPTPTPAAGCGDADGSGSVTVTDGVQTLRAAAGLSSVCTLAVCDVDGSGVITVTDGVNVLRAAAGLPAILNCGG